MESGGLAMHRGPPAPAAIRTSPPKPPTLRQGWSQRQLREEGGGNIERLKKQKRRQCGQKKRYRGVKHWGEEKETEEQDSKRKKCYRDPQNTLTLSSLHTHKTQVHTHASGLCSYEGSG